MRPARILGAALALALALSGCSSPAAETPQPSDSIQTQAPTPEPINDPYVWADWSQLEGETSYPTRYERWHGQFTDHLIPSSGYGPLIPFSGGAIADEWGGEYGTYAPEGLMTLEGKVVVDPVYAAVTRLSSGKDDWFDLPDTYYPAFLLSRYTGDGEFLFDGYRDVRSALCAADGSWVTPEYRFSYTAMVYGEGVQDGMIFAQRDDDTLVMLEVSSGKELFSVALDGLSENQRMELLNDVYYGGGRIILQNRLVDWNAGEGHSLRCWDADSGEELSLPADVDTVTGFSEGLWSARSSTSKQWGYLDENLNWVIPPQFSYALPFKNGVALLGSHAHQLIDKGGNILYETPTYDTYRQTGDYWYFLGYSGDAGLVLDSKGNEINSPLLFGGYVDTLDYGWAVMTPYGSPLLARGTESWPIPENWGYIRATTEDTIYFDSWEFFSPDDRNPRWSIWHPETEAKPTVFMGSFDSLRTDPITGEGYCVINNMDGTYSVFSPEGEPLFDNVPGWPNLYGGRCLCTETDGGRRTVTLLGKDGSPLLYRSWATPFD